MKIKIIINSIISTILIASAIISILLLNSILSLVIISLITIAILASITILTLRNIRNIKDEIETPQNMLKSIDTFIKEITEINIFINTTANLLSYEYCIMKPYDNIEEHMCILLESIKDSKFENIKIVYDELKILHKYYTDLKKSLLLEIEMVRLCKNDFKDIIKGLISKMNKKSAKNFVNQISKIFGFKQLNIEKITQYIKQLQDINCKPNGNINRDILVKLGKLELLLSKTK